MKNNKVPDATDVEDIFYLVAGRLLPAFLLLPGGLLMLASIVQVGGLLVCLGLLLGIGMEVSYRKFPLETKTLKEISDYPWCLSAKDELRSRRAIRPALSLYDLNVIRNLQLRYEAKAARIAEDEAQQHAIEEISRI